MFFFFFGAAPSPAAGQQHTARSRTANPEKPKTNRNKARKLLKIGVRLLRNGYYVGALDKFKRAYALYPSPKIYFNIGQTQKELGRYVKAIEAYERFIANAPADTPKELMELAKKRLAELQNRIGVLKLTIAQAGAQVTINGKPCGRAPLKGPVRLMPGTHSLVVKKKGYTTTAVDIRLRAGQRVSRKIRLKRPQKELVKVQVVYKTVKIPKKGVAVLWTATAVSAAAGLAASILGGLALREEKKMKDTSLSISARRDAADRGDKYAKATDGLFISGGVLAVGTLFWYLFYVRPSGGEKRVRVESSKNALRPSFDGGHAGFALSF
jgi:tetratricopeptide (TPR) repeat protein